MNISTTILLISCFFIFSCSKSSQPQKTDIQTILSANKLRSSEEEARFSTMVEQIKASHNYRRHLENMKIVHRIGALQQLDMTNFDSLKYRSCIFEKSDTKACMVYAGATGNIEEYASAADSMLIYLNRLYREFPLMHRLTLEEWKELISVPLMAHYDAHLAPFQKQMKPKTKTAN